MVFLTTRIAFLLSRNGIIKKEDEPIYVYGAETALSYLAAFTAMLLIGLVSGQLLNLTVFMLAYTALRGCAGGYHASTHLRCFICSVMICIVNVVLYIVLPTSVKDWLSNVLLFCSIGILLISAPSQNLVNPKTRKELKRNKMKMIVWIAALTVIVIVLRLARIGGNTGFPITCALVTVTILSVINSLQYKISMRRNKHG